MDADCNNGSLPAGDFIPEILYEDNHLLIVNKKAGMLTQGDASGELSLLDHLKRYLKIRDRKPGNVYLGMVQRLDKPVSGVIVFAKTSKSAARISAQIRERRLTKCYLAVTAAGSVGMRLNDRGADDWRIITHQLRRAGNITVVDDTSEEALKASLKLKTVLVNGQAGFHLVRLITGRKHQIRAQLAALGMPICGDRKYDSPVPISDDRILLHSYLVRLTHPTRKTDLEIVCAPPDEFHLFFSTDERATIAAALGDLGC